VSETHPAGGPDPSRPSRRDRNEGREPTESRRRGPKPVSDILGELFASRGFGRLLAQKELEAAWDAAVGEPGRRQTRVGEVRRGVLNVTVAHSTLLEELAAYQKPALLAALRRNAPGTVIHDIRFRVGPIEPLAPEESPIPTPEATQPKPKRRRPRDGR
jgi:predicted nucleic acid-binding Zn ribbon protein